MPLSKPKAILFDWDNTLVNTWPTIADAMNHTLRHMGEPEWSMEKVRNTIKKSMRDSFPTLFGERWEEAAEIYQARFRAIHLEKLEALPQAEDLLKYLETKPIYLALVSNKKGPNLRKELAHIGWEHYFQAAVGADDAEHDKPEPAPVLMALEKSGLSSSADVWFYGDTAIDLECAERTGCTPILYGDVEAVGGVYHGFPYALHARDHKAMVEALNQFFA